MALYKSAFDNCKLLTDQFFILSLSLHHSTLVSVKSKKQNRIRTKKKMNNDKKPCIKNTIMINQ